MKKKVLSLLILGLLCGNNAFAEYSCKSLPIDIGSRTGRAVVGDLINKSRNFKTFVEASKTEGTELIINDHWQVSGPNPTSDTEGKLRKVGPLRLVDQLEGFNYYFSGYHMDSESTQTYFSFLEIEKKGVGVLFVSGFKTTTIITAAYCTSKNVDRSSVNALDLALQNVLSAKIEFGRPIDFGTAETGAAWSPLDPK